MHPSSPANVPPRVPLSRQSIARVAASRKQKGRQRLISGCTAPQRQTGSISPAVMTNMPDDDTPAGENLWPIPPPVRMSSGSAATPRIASGTAPRR